MAERIVEFILPPPFAELGKSVVAKSRPIATWSFDGGDVVVIRAIMSQGRIERLLDELEDRFEGIRDFRIVVQELRAIIPAPEDDESPEDGEPADGPAKDAATVDAAPGAGDSPKAAAGSNDASEPRSVPGRISRAELYEDVERTVRLDRNFFLQVVIATVVAAVGLIRDSPAVVIGAMVIAPLLGPHMALALATTLGDPALGRRAVYTSLSGLGLTLLLAALLGTVLHIDPTVQEIASRTGVSASDIVLALASGVAGALGFAAGLGTSLVGVMVAVALAPPAVVMALLAARGEWTGATGAGLLLATNLVCVNLAAVLTFAAKGLRPRRWWEAERSRRATRVSVGFWLLMLSGIAALILLAPLTAPVEPLDPADDGPASGTLRLGVDGEFGAGSTSSPTPGLTRDPAAGDPAATEATNE
ncbi:MAG: TIGR00341 family protein [Phycisphaerales bacterium]